MSSRKQRRQTKRTNRRGRRVAPTYPPLEPGEFAWLACDDCASTIHREWYGRRPDLISSIVVDHSPTCPSKGSDGRMISETREIKMQLLPESMRGTSRFVTREEVEQR